MTSRQYKWALLVLALVLLAGCGGGGAGIQGPPPVTPPPPSPPVVPPSPPGDPLIGTWDEVGYDDLEYGFSRRVTPPSPGYYGTFVARPDHTFTIRIDWTNLLGMAKIDRMGSGGTWQGANAWLLYPYGRDRARPYKINEDGLLYFTWPNGRHTYGLWWRKIR